jgi:hypothetical protein
MILLMQPVVPNNDTAHGVFLVVDISENKSKEFLKLTLPLQEMH